MHSFYSIYNLCRAQGFCNGSRSSFVEAAACFLYSEQYTVIFCHFMFFPWKAKNSQKNN